MPSLQTIGLAVLAAAQAVSAATAGCGKAPPSSGQKTITVNGRQRQYILQLPNNYDRNKPHRVVFGYHWLDGSMNDVANGGFYELRQRQGGSDSTIFVAPNGLNRGWANQGGEDIAFTDALVNMVKNDLCADETQFFATGWSYGGAMSHSVACSRPDVFRSVAVIAGALLSGCSGGNTPVPYLGMHGAADNVLPIAMGRQLRDHWIRTNGCANKNAPEPSAGQQAHMKTVYDCTRAPVIWIANGGGHVPDPTGNGGQKFAPPETWDFWNSIAGLPGTGTGGTPTNPGTPTTIVTSVINTPTQPAYTPPPPQQNCSPRWGQCGGQGWQGPTCCEAGSTCRQQNQWYSQCL